MQSSTSHPDALADTQLHCPACDYNLTGVVGDHCPECGWEINVDVLAGERLTLSRRTQRIGVVVLSLVCGVVLFVLAYCAFRPQLPFDRTDPWSVFLMAWVGGLILVGVIFLLIGVAGWRCRSRWPLRMPGLRAFAILAAVLQWLTLFGLVGLLNESAWGDDFLAMMMFVFLFAMPGAVLLFVTHVAFRGPVGRRVVRMGQDADSDFSRGPLFSVAVLGPFERGAVATLWRDEGRMSNSHLEALIEQTWLDQKEAADREDRILFNGEMARLIGASVEDGCLQLRLGPTNYRDFVGTNLFNGQLFATLGPMYFSNPLGTTATVVTRDGWIGYGRRSHRVAFHAGYLHTFGGALEMQDRHADGSFDVFDALSRELREELAIEGRDIERWHVTGLVRDHQIHQPELLLDVCVRLTRADLLDRLDWEADDQEHTALEWCADDPAAVVPFLRAAGRVAPVCVAAIMLHGLLQWGQTWYERTSFELFGALPGKCTL